MDWRRLRTLKIRSRLLLDGIVTEWKIRLLQSVSHPLLPIYLQSHLSVCCSGNNVAAFGPSGDPISNTSPSLIFDARYDDSLDPSNPSNLHASITNAFYVANTVHDIAYKYGFTEDAFNFQHNNLKQGGKGRDRVLLSVQDKSGFNNANFATPPEYVLPPNHLCYLFDVDGFFMCSGQPGICRMFIWDHTNPKRDGAMENDILVHELAHGITNRMTGGGSGRCLQTTEAGGMGEGWSDAIAEYVLSPLVHITSLPFFFLSYRWVVQKSNKVEDFVMGQYVLGSKRGIRQFPYSTNPCVSFLQVEILPLYYCMQNHQPTPLFQLA